MRTAWSRKPRTFIDNSLYGGIIEIVYHKDGYVYIYMNIRLNNDFYFIYIFLINYIIINYYRNQIVVVCGDSYSPGTIHNAIRSM